MKIHEKYMKRCLQIAKNAVAHASPNPAVGALLVYQDKIIAEGYTSSYGGPHAEVMAIRGVNSSELLQKSRLYVTLEPCCHHGKTPPCTDLILNSGIPEIIVGTLDPNPKVGGKGVALLEAAGRKVRTGVLEADCQWHHRRFLCNQEKKRPYIILKWAQSPDGYMAPPDALRQNGEPFWISSPESRQWAHRWRAEEAGILTGWKTVAADNPSLTTRLWNGDSPKRIILDPGAKLKGTYKIWDEKAETFIFYDKDKEVNYPKHVKGFPISFGKSPLEAILTNLLDNGISSILVEGGAFTLNEFIEKNLWDEARVFQSSTPLGSGLSAPVLSTEANGRLSSGPDFLYLWHNDKAHSF